MPAHHSCQFALLSLSDTSCGPRTFSTGKIVPYVSNFTICPPTLTPNTASPLTSLLFCAIHCASFGASHNCFLAGNGASRKPSGRTHEPAGSVENNMPRVLNVIADLLLISRRAVRTCALLLTYASTPRRSTNHARRHNSAPAANYTRNSQSRGSSHTQHPISINHSARQNCK
jgi:hypothetical protein